MLTRYFPRAGKDALKPPVAKYLDVILYSREQITIENKGAFSPHSFCLSVLGAPFPMRGVLRCSLCSGVDFSWLCVCGILLMRCAVLCCVCVCSDGQHVHGHRPVG